MRQTSEDRISFGKSNKPGRIRHSSFFLAGWVLLFLISLAGKSMIGAGESGTEGVDILDAGLEEGIYLSEGELEGGSGRASFDGPLILIIRQDAAFLAFTMSSPNYDYLILDGEKFLPLDKEGNSSFLLPLDRIDEDFHFTADTTAMSEPHEVSYSVGIYKDKLCRLELPGQGGKDEE